VAEPLFLDVEDILYIHRREIERAGGDASPRDPTALEAVAGAPQASHGGEYLMDLFNMAAAYIVSIAFRHPFLDGNKRTAAAAALTFLHLNGHMVNERHPEELADLVLALLRREVDREDVGRWFRDRCVPLAPPDL